MPSHLRLPAALWRLAMAIVSPALAEPSIDWSEGTGVVVRLPSSTICLDAAGDEVGPNMLFDRNDTPVPLGAPASRSLDPRRVELSYEVITPQGVGVTVRRQIELHDEGRAVALTEVFTLIPDGPIDVDLEIIRPFGWSGRGDAAITLPLNNGWACPLALGQEPEQAEYRLGNWIGGDGVSQLALPVVELHSSTQRIALCTDPTFGALFSAQAMADGRAGSIRYRYAGSRVPITSAEERRFGLWCAPSGDGPNAFADSLNAFFDLMLPDVRPGPDWLHDIAMISYDYLSDGAEGWEKDVRLLAEWLTPEERSHVALCLHGWYDAIGSYGFDRKSGLLMEDWVAFGPTSKIPLSIDEIKRRLRLAKDLGFRTLLYFADGLAMDSGHASYRDDWVYRDANGAARAGWQGPDTFAQTYLLNPAHPEVSKWFCDYLDALLATYGPHIDGLVWDETFHAQEGQIADSPEPAYCDRAMLDLVKTLTRRVSARYPQKVFLASDCRGAVGGVPGYGMVAHGAYQDTACAPAAWSYGLFPNFRNTLWSCNWGPMTGFFATQFGVEAYGVPVAISNGWGDDRGPSEWTARERDAILGLFRERLVAGPRTRMLHQSPDEVTSAILEAPSDPIPAPRPGETNCALAAVGATATASSADDYGGGDYGPAGAIDGQRTDVGWGGGHGWASGGDDGPPQWIEIDLGRRCALRRFVIITYASESGAEPAAKWGVADYRIEVWDERSGAWRTAVTESRGRVARVRVHQLDRPVKTTRFRVVVTNVRPLDGRARLLEVEAWGRSQLEVTE